MVEFAYYNFSFEKRGQKGKQYEAKIGADVFPDNILERMREEIGNVWQSEGHKTDLYFPSGAPLYETEVMHFYDDVALLEVRDNKKKHVMPRNGHQKQAVEHCPICRVIIDCRPQARAILVELRKEAFRNNPDKVVELIHYWCVRKLDLVGSGQEMKVTQRRCMGDIWEIVRNRTIENRDVLRQIKVIFTGDSKVQRSEKAAFLAQVVECLGGTKGNFAIATSPDTQRRLAERSKDTVNMITLLVNNDYRLQAFFKNSGKYEHGKNSMAVYGVEPGFLTNFNQARIGFENGDVSFNLILWLDGILTDANVTYHPVGRKRNNRRDVKKVS